jgi:hypothetical protein
MYVWMRCECARVCTCVCDCDCVRITLSSTADPLTGSKRKNRGAECTAEERESGERTSKKSTNDTAEHTDDDDVR